MRAVWAPRQHEKINKNKQGKSTRNCVTIRVFLWRIYICRYLTSPPSRWDGLNLRRVIHKQHGLMSTGWRQKQPIASSSMEKSFKPSWVTVDIRTEKQRHNWNDAYSTSRGWKLGQADDVEQGNNQQRRFRYAKRSGTKMLSFGIFRFVIRAPCAFNRSRGHWLNHPFWCHCVSNLIKVEERVTGGCAHSIRVHGNKLVKKEHKLRVEKVGGERITKRQHMVEMSLFGETKHEIRSRNFFHKIFGYSTKIAIFRQTRKKWDKRERNLTFSWNKSWTCMTPRVLESRT